MQIGTEDPVRCLEPWQPGKPALKVPDGSWDCHAHVIGDGPWVTPRNYDPPSASIDDYIALLDHLGFANGVLVQVSVHGLDNSLILEALRRYPSRLRGVVAVSADVSDTELADMHGAGVRGVRLLSLTRGGVSPEAAVAVADRIAPYGWHIELGVPGHALPALRPMIARLPVPVVLAHFGDCDPRAGTDGEQFAALRAILSEPDRFVKLSAAYRLCTRPWNETVPIARALLAEHARSLLWGSDWPHVAIVDPDLMPRTEALVDLVDRWTSDPSVAQAVFVDNPVRLYGRTGTD